MINQPEYTARQHESQVGQGRFHLTTAVVEDFHLVVLAFVDEHLVFV